MTPSEANPGGSGTPGTPDLHLDRLLSDVEQPWYKSFVQNVREAIHPKKLPPLELTSKPIPVKDIWGFYGGQERKAGAMSMLIHVSVIALLVILGTNRAVQQTVKQVVTLVDPNLTPYVPQKISEKKAGGGGGGGDRSPLPASRGKLPKISDRQFVPPMAVINNPKPKLVMEPTIIAPDPPPNIVAANLGDPMSKYNIPSNGNGSGGGIGSGEGGGVGSGKGAGAGPGEGGGYGGGVFKIGGVDKKPQLVYKVDPDYSEEARKAKFQGTVVLAIIVDENGLPHDVRVVRPLGLGLDQKAIEAVEKWRFRPGMKDGHPVKVAATIEVNFRLL
jgi:protein TonB